MKLAMRTTLILCMIVGMLVLVSSSSQQVPDHVYTAGIAAGVQAALADFCSAAQELWEIAHTNNLGVWHLVVVVLAVLIPRKIIVLLLR
jgi:hypothetical protein